jgi:3-hydroxy-9,10-secoandrosta-1,3,5(10)-triene-9,17-dione monooxygenase
VQATGQGGAGGAAPPDFATLRRRAEDLVPALRQRAQKAEAIRRVPDATIADLHRTGLFRMLQPRRVGGSELPYRALIELGAIVARGCGSTAWVLNNLASHHWMLAMWPPAAQDEIWGESPDHLIGSAFVFPVGRAQKVDGGYRLSGRWPFSSGIDPSTWNMVGAIVYDERNKPVEHRMFLVPARDYRIIDTWHVTGLRGTGSKDVETTDAIVPEYRSLPLKAIAGGPTPGSEANPAPLYKLPALSLFAFVVAGVSLGIAQGALADVVAATRTRASTYAGKALADLATIQLRIAEAGALIDTAETLMLKDCDEAQRLTEAGETPSVEQKVRWRRDGAYAAGMCTQAVDTMFVAMGGGGIYLSHPIQRAFRDIHAANAHYALSWDVNGTLYGRVALGLPPDTATL